MSTRTLNLVLPQQKCPVVMRPADADYLDFRRLRYPNSTVDTSSPKNSENPSSFLPRSWVCSQSNVHGRAYRIVGTAGI
jgi:hypothetical protein